MVVLNSGLNKIRDLLETNLTKGQNGTGTGTANENDTGLEVALGSTLKTLTTNKADKIFKTIQTLETTDANGLNLSEFENQFSTGESLIRFRHTALSKDNTKEFRFITVYEFSGE